MKELGMRLQRARKVSGLSLRELAKRAGVSHMAIKKYEDGQLYPSSELLMKLAPLLSVSVEFFFRPITVELGEIKFRKKGNLGEATLRALRAEVEGQMERRLELESLYPAPPSSSFHPPAFSLQTVETLSQVEGLANELREHWKLGLAPIYDLIDVLESHGIRVFVLAHQNVRFDGLATTAKESSIIVVSSHFSGDRQRFTMAHELGHMLLQGRLASHLDEELACHRFAGALLLPREALQREIGSKRHAIELRELTLLKEQYRLSMMAICFRLRDLAVISENYFQELKWLFVQNEWDRCEPGEQIPPEQPHLFTQMVLRALSEEFVNESKAAELLDSSLEEFRAFRFVESSAHYAAPSQ